MSDTIYFAPRRLKRIMIDPEILAKISTNSEINNVICQNPLPKDAKIYNMGFDHSHALFFIVYEHESFEEIPQGGMIPEHRLEYTSNIDAELGRLRYNSARYEEIEYAISHFHGWANFKYLIKEVVKEDAGGWSGKLPV